MYWQSEKKRNRFALSNEHPNTTNGKTVDYDIQNFRAFESQMEKQNKNWHHLRFRTGTGTGKGKKAAKQRENKNGKKRIQRVLMAIPCAVYKVFRNTEKKKKISSYAGADVPRAHAHSYTRLREREKNTRTKKIQ